MEKQKSVIFGEEGERNSRLWPTAVEPDQLSTFIELNIKCGDAVNGLTDKPKLDQSNFSNSFIKVSSDEVNLIHDFLLRVWETLVSSLIYGDLAKTMLGKGSIS